MRDAKGELYKEQEATRRQWLDSQTDQLKSARGKADELITQAKTDLTTEAETAKTTLLASSGEFADQIAKSLLGNRA